MMITVIGAGTWGTALGRALALNGHEVRIWSKFKEETDQLSASREHPHLPGAVIPESISFTNDLGKAADGAEFILMAVPSVYTRVTSRELAPYINQDSVIISAAKGIESDTLMTLTEVISDELKARGRENRIVATM